MRRLTGDELISTVRRRAGAHNTGTQGSTDADILDILNEEMMTTMVPYVRRVREEYFVISRKIPLEPSRLRYRIPARAVGQQIRSIFTSDGPNNRERMERISPEQLDELSFGDGTGSVWFYLESNHIVLAGNQAPSGDLEVAFLARPGQLVLESATRKVVSVDGRTITLDQEIPASWESAASFDIHSPLSGAELKQLSLSRVSASGTLLEVVEEIDGSVHGTYAPVPGDYVCLEGEAALPALPIELHIPLAQAAVCRVVEALGDIELLTYHRQTLSDMLQGQTAIISNRIDSHAKKLVPSNPLWGSGRGQRWAWYS